MPDWQQLHVPTPDPEAVGELLESLGACSVTFTDSADVPVLEPAPGETPLWPDTTVTALFEADADLDAIRRQLADSDLCDPEHIRVEQVPDQAWERAWMDEFKPMAFGERLWVCPLEQTPPPEAQVVLRMDPGLAFGTGTHATTRLCLEWLDGADLSDATVIDFGCGSGILAVAAALLGAHRVLALDIDPQAHIATRQNAQANGVADRIELVSPEDLRGRQADVVLANILAGTLIGLHDTLTTAVRPDGMLIMSGILAEQADAVTKVYSDHFLINSVNSEGWVRLDGRRFAQPG